MPFSPLKSIRRFGEYAAFIFTAEESQTGNQQEAGSKQTLLYKDYMELYSRRQNSS
jgi:pyridoxal biosynthesis lyase PdxS